MEAPSLTSSNPEVATANQFGSNNNNTINKSNTFHVSTTTTPTNTTPSNTITREPSQTNVTITSTKRNTTNNGEQMNLWNALWSYVSGNQQLNKDTPQTARKRGNEIIICIIEKLPLESRSFSIGDGCGSNSSCKEDLCGFAASFLLFLLLLLNN